MVRNLMAVLVAAMVVFPALPADAAGKDVVTAAWVYVGPVGDAGWTFGHDLGRRGVAAESPWLKTEFVESVSEADAERVIETYARKGVDVIFTTSFGFSDPTIKVAKKYPKTIFMHCSGFKRADNVGTYFGRMEQAKFLAGIAAGLVTGSAKIGYVAPMPIPEVVRFVNAFTLGVRQVKPEAVVKVVWTGDWFLPTVEKQAADSLMDAGCDVIATGCDSSAPLAAAEARKTWAVGYDSDAHQYAPQHWLTAPIWDWTILYRPILGKVREGTWKSEDLWWDIASGVILLAPWGPRVPEEVKAQVAQWRERLASGERDVFTGPVRDQSGKVVFPEGKTVRDRETLEMMWFVEGVQGSIPRK